MFFFCTVHMHMHVKIVTNSLDFMYGQGLSKKIPLHVLWTANNSSRFSGFGQSRGNKCWFLIMVEYLHLNVLLLLSLLLSNWLYVLAAKHFHPSLKHILPNSFFSVLICSYLVCHMQSSAKLMWFFSFTQPNFLFICFKLSTKLLLKMPLNKENPILLGVQVTPANPTAHILLDIVS